MNGILADLGQLAQAGGLVGWMQRAQLASFEPRPEWPGAMDVLTDCTLYAADVLPTPFQSIPEGRNWLVLCGNYGAGKSHLAAGIVWEALLSGFTARFVPWVETLDAIRDSFRDPKVQTGQLMAQFTEPYVLAIDDLDKEPGSEWSQKTLYKVLNHRYNHSLPTVITLNHSLSSQYVAGIMPPAVLDRVLERAWRVVEFDGPSFRSQMVLRGD